VAQRATDAMMNEGSHARLAASTASENLGKNYYRTGNQIGNAKKNKKRI
jgi:hypothetical protein